MFLSQHLSRNIVSSVLVKWKFPGIGVPQIIQVMNDYLTDELRACDPKLLQPEPSRGDPDDPRAGAPSCDYKMYKEDLPSANQTWQ
jgi:hypothetical protein